MNFDEDIWKEMIFRELRYLVRLREIENDQNLLNKDEIVTYDEAVCGLYDDAEFEAFVETYDDKYGGALNTIFLHFNRLLKKKLAPEQAVKSSEFNELCDVVAKFLFEYPDSTPLN